MLGSIRALPWTVLINRPSNYRKLLDHIRRTAGPFTDPDAVSEEALARFDTMKVLYVHQMAQSTPYLHRSKLTVSNSVM